MAVIHRELFAALTSSVVSTRVPDDSTAKGWTYALLPDAGVRITAARLLLSYLAGLPPSQSDIRVQHVPGGVAGRSSVGGMLEDLRAIGVGITDVVQDIERQAARHAPIEAETRVETER